MCQKVKLHATTIKQLKQQFGHLSAILNQRQQGTLQINTIQNPKNNAHYMVITTRSRKALIEAPQEVEDVHDVLAE